MAFDSKAALNHAIKYLADAAIKRNAGGWIPPKEEERQRKEQIRQELQQSRDAERQAKEQKREHEKSQKLLSKQFPTHYMPEVGRQVMADGGQPRNKFAYGGHQEESAAPPLGFFEVAPGKTWDPEAQASWEKLHPQAKQAISNRMVGEFLSRWQRTSGIVGEIRPGLGGFGGFTNPNYSFHPYNPDHLDESMSQLGELFSQDAMMGAHAKPFKNSFPAGVIRIHMPKNVSPEEAHAVYEHLNKLGLAEGHSTDPSAGTMDIISGDGKKETIKNAKKIDEALEGRYDVSSYPTNIAFPEHGEHYGISGTQTGKSSGSSASAAFNNLKAEASRRLKELLEEAHRQGGGHQGEVNFGDTLAPGQPHPDTLPALIPKSGTASRGPQPIDEPRPDITLTSHSPENLERIASHMWKNHPVSGGEELSGPEALKRVLDFHTKNLLALWDATPQAQRQTSRFWYRAAHALGNAYAEDHGIMPRAAHGIMAVLSPQNPWDKNVTQAERLMDILHHHMDTRWTPAMSEVAYSGGSKKAGLPEDKGTKETGPHTWADIEGKTLREVLEGPHGQHKAAMWIRAFDEAHNPTEYQAVSPTGEFIGTQMNKTGSAPDTASWNSYNPIKKAISIWFDPSRENINEQIGDNHKVREFYNVITNPHDPNGVVIDTHAVAAGEMLPHGSSAMAVHRNFGSTPDVKGQQYLERIGTPWIAGESPSRTTGPSGAKGDYPVYAEAVRRAAWARGVHPSEMQSVTWERIRQLFSDKGPEAQRKAREIWSHVASGKISQEQAIHNLIQEFGGEQERSAAWHGTQSGATSIGNVRPGSYVRPQNITEKTPPVKRYADGGSVYEPHQRAEEQGYSIRGYHVTRGDRAGQISSAQRFDPYQSALPGEEATFFWDDPEAANKWIHASTGIETFDPERMSARDIDKAERHASTIMPVRIQPGKTSTIDWQEATGRLDYDHQKMKQIISVARKMGFDTLRIKNMHEYKMGKPHDQIAVLNPHVIRSEFAKFDPSRQGEENLGAARGGAIDRDELQKAAHAGRGGDSMLAHINPQEAALLKRMGGSGTINPDTGLPQFDNPSMGDYGGSWGGGGGGGGANPGDIAGGGFGSGNVGGGSSGGGGGGGSSFGGGGGGGGGGGSGGDGGSGFIGFGGGGGGSSMPGIGLGSVDAFGAPGSMNTFGSTDPGKESDKQIAEVLAAGMKPGGNIGASFVKEAISPDLSGGNSPLASGISSYNQNALDAINDRMRAGQQAERDESYERSVLSPVTKQVNVPNAGDLYGATNAPLAVGQPPSGMFNQPTTGTTQFGQSIRQSGFPTQQTGAEDPSHTGYAEQMAKTARESWLAANTEPQSPRLGDLATPTPNRPFTTPDRAGSIGSMPIGAPQFGSDLTPMSSQPVRPITPTPFSSFPQAVQKQMIPNRPDSSFGQTLIDPTGKYTNQALDKMKVAEDAVTMLNSPTLAGSLFRAFTPTPTPATPSQQAAIERMYKGAYGADGLSAGTSVRSSFNEAFADARARGDATFSWTNPATGKTGQYTTQLARKEGGRVPSLKNPEDWIAHATASNEARKVAKAKQYKPQKPRSTAIVERAIMLSSRKS